MPFALSRPSHAYSWTFNNVDRGQCSPHYHGLQFCSQGRGAASIRSHSTLSPTFQRQPFHTSNTSPYSVSSVAIPVLALMAVIVVTTPSDTGFGDLSASATDAKPPIRAPVRRMLWMY